MMESLIIDCEKFIESHIQSTEKNDTENSDFFMSWNRNYCTKKNYWE